MFSQEELQTESFLRSLSRQPLRVLAQYPFGCRTVRGAEAYQNAALANPEQAAIALNTLLPYLAQTGKANSPFAAPLIERIIEKYPQLASKSADEQSTSARAAGVAGSTDLTDGLTLHTEATPVAALTPPAPEAPLEIAPAPATLVTNAVTQVTPESRAAGPAVQVVQGSRQSLVDGISELTAEQRSALDRRLAQLIRAGVSDPTVIQGR